MGLPERITSHPVLSRILEILDEHHAENMVVVAVGDVGVTYTDWFVIAEALTRDHLDALRDALTEDMPPTHREGHRGQDWYLLDYVDVVVHLMLPEARAFYRLEDLWGDAPQWSVHPQEEEPRMTP